MVIRDRRQFSRWLWLAIVIIMGLALYQQASSLATVQPIDVERPPNSNSQALRAEYAKLLQNLRLLEDQQRSARVDVISQADIQNELAAFALDFAESNLADAQRDLTTLKANIDKWQSKLEALTGKTPQSAANPTLQSGDILAPILLYHYTPADFGDQLQYLVNHHYTAISLSQLSAALLYHAPLPPKPVVITFDDGYANQMTAFHWLEKFQIKATFFIIISRANSGCSGLTTNCDPLYLSWDDIKQLDQSGLITIGDHTIDHPNLAGLDATEQQHEIVQAQTILEQHLNHPITTLAYPYGSFNATTIAIAKNAQFVAAVSTIPGIIQSPDYLYALRRVRNAYLLP